MNNMNKELKTDCEYFIDKIIEHKNDPEKVQLYAKRVKLLLDALIIYKLHKNPERRIYNIDCGNSIKGHCESLVHNLKGDL